MICKICEKSLEFRTFKIDKITRQKERMICRYCGVKEGQIHQLGCLLEECPKCLGQLLTCGCWDYCDDRGQPYTIEQWLSKLNAIGRIPYIHWSIVCGYCGELFPDLFMVSNKVWKKYVIPPLQKEELCKTCFEKMKRLFPKGWKKVDKNNSKTTAKKWF